MRNVRCLALRIENDAGFDDNEYIQESIRAVTEQVGLLRTTRAWFYDTKNMDFLNKGRLIYREETLGAEERLLGESRHTWGLVQKVKRPIQVRESVEEPFSETWPENFDIDQKLARVLLADRTRRIYLVNGCELIWQKADWKTGEEEKHFHELRLSTEPGNEGAMFDLARRLSKILRLQLETGSMEMRALSMLSGEEPEMLIQKPEDGKGKKAGKWLQSLLLKNSTGLVDAINGFLREPQDAEALHRMRVALRVLRSSLSFGRDLFMDEDYRKTATYLQQLGNISSEARDLEVLLESIRSVVNAESKLLQDELEKRRVLAYRKVHEFIHAGRATVLLTEYLNLIHRKESWKEEAWDLPASEYETKMREAWTAHLIRKSRHFNLEDMDRTHQLRIQVKKLRYVMRNMENQDKSRKGVLTLLGELQDVLGWIHDRSQQTRILTRIFKDTGDPEVKFEVGYYLGILAERDQSEGESLGKTAQKLFKHLRETEI